ncbi:MAG: PD40 domain-containing protein [Deltaproteobacteria bacterium]|nr:PD40 domain-containing protein [Deltaproteobacteria bacterium]
MKLQIVFGLWIALSGTAVAAGFSDGNSYSSVVSADGRWVAFESDANNLVPGNGDSQQHIYLRDRQSGSTRRITNRLDGKPADQPCNLNGMSSDGRYILFDTYARGLVDLPDPPNHDRDYWQDGYVYDRLTGKTELVTITPTGKRNLSMVFTQAISPDGRFVLFYAWNNWDEDYNRGTEQVYVRDRVLGTTERVSLAFDGGATNRHSIANSISADGRYVVYSSEASNILPNDKNEFHDVFLYDRQLAKTYLVSKTSEDVSGNGHSVGGLISPDGRYVAYYTMASNIIAGDTNEITDVAIYDRETGQTMGVLTSRGGAGGSWPFRAQDFAFGGGKIFFSFCQDLAPGDTNKTCDIYSYDLLSGEIRQESLGPGGIQGNSEWGPALYSVSPDGRFLTYAIDSTNFVPGDTFANFEVYFRNLMTGDFELISQPGSLKLKVKHRSPEGDRAVAQEEDRVGENIERARPEQADQNEQTVHRKPFEFSRVIKR